MRTKSITQIDYKLLQEKKVLDTLSTISEQMMNDKENIEKYAASLGYNIDLIRVFSTNYANTVYQLYPVLNYMLHESFNDSEVIFGNMLTEKQLFAVCNPELYMVNRFYHLIEKIDDKKRTIKMERCQNILSDTLRIFSIETIRWGELVNGKYVFFFDEVNFAKIKSILMYTNKITESVVKYVLKNQRNFIGTNFYETLQNCQDKVTFINNFDLINKYVIKIAIYS